MENDAFQVLPSVVVNMTALSMSPVTTGAVYLPKQPPWAYR